MKSRRSIFKMPSVMKITGRSSSITNAFINAVIPAVPPSDADIQEALKILGMTSDNIACVYCGDPHSEWDHLRPLVKEQRPTGYITEIQNLVPACGKCNQSKGNKYWRDWINSKADKSPTTRGIKGLELRVQRLLDYEQWRRPTHVDFDSIIDADLLAAHWTNWEGILNKMKEAQSHAEQLRIALREALSNSKNTDPPTKISISNRP